MDKALLWNVLKSFEERKLNRNFKVPLCLDFTTSLFETAVTKKHFLNLDSTSYEPGKGIRTWICDVGFSSLPRCHSRRSSLIIASMPSGKKSKNFERGTVPPLSGTVFSLLTLVHSFFRIQFGYFRTKKVPENWEMFSFPGFLFLQLGGTPR